MKQDNPIRSAIDESLSGVHFDAKDMRAVLRAAKNHEQEPAPRTPARGSRFSMAFAMAMLLICVIPAGFLALRAQGMRTARISAAPGTAALTPQLSADPQADLIISPENTALPADESEAIRIARACFESVCDTSIFTFEEYAVSAGLTESGGGYAEYAVEMTCIYGNGCRFSVQVALPEGRVLAHSAPELATMPTYLDSTAAQVAAWRDKYGPHLMTWPQDAQAEFSRRYEGGMLRAAKPGELTAQEAAELAERYVRTHARPQEGVVLFCYPMLYAERAATDGTARYVVSCFTREVTDDMPEPLAVISFAADGSDVVAEIN